jgi:putative transposase
VVFIPKYRKKKLYGSIRTDLGEELHRLVEQKESKILEGHMMSDHIHMLIQIPPKYSVTQVIGYIKGKSAIYVAQGYFVSTVGLDEDVIRNYILAQEEDRRQDGQQQLSL